MTAPDPLECLNSRAAADRTTCGEPDSAHCERCQGCPGTCTCLKPRPAYADPDLGHEWDENGEHKTNVYAGWDLAFGCRINFTLAEGGAPRASVRLSDQARRDGGCNRAVTRDQIRAFAHHLIQMTEDMNELTAKENDRG